MLAERLQSVLERGNYERLTTQDVTHAFAERSLFPLNVVVDTSVYEEFRDLRPRRDPARGRRSPAGMGCASAAWTCPDLRSGLPVHPLQGRAASSTSPRPSWGSSSTSPGTTILKLFRNIPKADLEILFPNCQLEMRASDKLFFGVPALLGGIPVIAKLIPARLRWRS